MKDPRPGVYSFPDDFGTDLPKGCAMAPVQADSFLQENVAVFDDFLDTHVLFTATFPQNAPYFEIGLKGWPAPRERVSPKEWDPKDRGFTQASPGCAAFQMKWMRVEEGARGLQATWNGPFPLGIYRCNEKFKGYIGALHRGEEFPFRNRVDIAVEKDRPYLFILGRAPCDPGDTLQGDFWLSRVWIGPAQDL